MKYKKGQEVWCCIGRSKGGDLPWRKGNVIRRNGKGYSIRTVQGCFDVAEKDIMVDEN